VITPALGRIISIAFNMPVFYLIHGDFEVSGYKIY
jgi:hypothetical protein